MHAKREMFDVMRWREVAILTRRYSPTSNTKGLR